MRKVFTAILIIILVLSMVAALVACVPEDIGTDPKPGPDPKPDPEPDPEPEPEPEPSDPTILSWSVDEMLKVLGESFKFKESVASFKFAVDDLVVADNDGLQKEYIAVVNGNIPADISQMEIYISIKERYTGSSVFGIIITEGKLYLEVNDLKLHLENVDTAYLINIVKTIAPELIPMIDGLLSGIGMTVEDIFNGFIKGWIFSQNPFVRFVDNVYNINFVFDVHNLLMSVLNLAGTFDLDGLLAGLGVVLPGNISLNTIIADIKNLIPEFDINISTKILSAGYDDDGYEIYENLGMGAEIKNANSEVVLGFSSEFNFYNTKQDIDIPTGLDTYDPFSITHMQMDFYLGAEMKSLDVGALIEMFAGQALLPKDTLIVNASAGITLRMQLDLNLKNNNENMLLLELYNGKDADDKTKRLAGIYFIDNKIKINLNELTPIYQGKNIEISMGDMTLTGEGGLLTGLLNMLKETIDSALEGFVPKTESQTTNMNDKASAYNGGNYIVSVNIDENGDADTNTGSVLSFINSLIKMIGFDNNIILSTENGITVKVNQDLFNAVKEFISDEATKAQIDNIAKIIGEINLNIGMKDFNFIGIEAVTIDWMQSPSLGIGLMVSNMLFGFQNKELANNIKDATKDKDYENSLKNILYGALEGVDLSGDISLKLPEGKLNIIAFLSKLGVPTDAIPLDGLILDIPQGGLTLDLSVSIQMSYNMKNPELSVAKIEVVNKKRLLIFEEGFMLGIYMTGGKIYVDAPGIKIYGFTIPKVAIEFDIFSMLKTEIDKIDIDLILSDWLPKTQAMADGNPTISDIIGIEINETTFKLALTSVAIQKLLAAFDVVFELPEMYLNAEVSEWKEVKLDLGLLLEDGKYATFDLAFTKIQLGGNVLINMPEFDDDEYLTSINDIVDGIVEDLLSGVSMDMNLKLTLPGGTFPLGQLLSGFVVGIPDIQLEVGDNELGNDVVLDLQLRLRMKYVADNKDTEFDESLNSTFLLEFVLNHEVFGIKPGILIGLYTLNGETFLDLSGFRIGDLNLPKFKLDINLPSLFAKLIGDIDIAGMIPNMGILSNMDDALDRNDYPVVSLSNTGLSVAITANAIAMLLATFGVEIAGLPEFDARVEIDAINGLNVSINNCKLLSLDLGINNVQLGKGVKFDLPEINRDEFPSSITAMLKDTVTRFMNGTQMRLGLKASVDPMIIYADDLLALFGIDFQTEENVAVIEIAEKMTLDIEVLLKLEYDPKNPLEGKAMLKFYLKNDFFLQQGAGKDGLLIALYCNASSGKMQTYVDLSGLKLGDAPFPKLKLDIDLMDIILKQIDNIEGLDEQLDGVIGGITNMSDVNNEQPEKPTLYVYQNALAFKIASEALMAMLSSFGVELELPFQFDLTADLKLGSEYDLNGLTILINTRDTGTEVSYTFNASLFIGDFIIGRPGIFTEADEMPDATDQTYHATISDALRQAANDLLYGTTATAELEVELRKHQYNIGQYLSKFIDTTMMSNLILDIKTNQKLGIKMNFAFKSRGDEASPKGLLLEFYLTSAPLFFADYVYDMSKPLISIIGDSEGKTYLDLSNIVLSAYMNNGTKKGVRLPKICLDIDILKIIDDQMSGLKSLDEMLDKWLGDFNSQENQEEPSTKVNDQENQEDTDNDAGNIIKKYIVLGLTDKRIDVKIASEAIKTILEVAGLAMELPPIEIDGFLDVGDTSAMSPNGLSIKAKIYDFDVVSPTEDNMLMWLAINFRDIRIGEGVNVAIKQLTQEEKDTFSPTINSALKDSLQNILTGTHIEANLEIRLPAGSYNVAELLGVFGVDAGIIPITLPDVKFTHPIDLVVKLTFIVENFDPTNSANNRFIFKLSLVEDVIPFATVDENGNAITSALMKAGTDLFKIFTIGDKRTYVDLSGFTFANISLPRFYIDTDVLAMVNKLIESQDIDKLIKDFLSGNSNNNNGGENGDLLPPTEDVADESDDSESVIQFPINITIIEKAIKLEATSRALMTMLSGFGVSLPIPDALTFKIVGELNGLGVYDPNLKLEVKVDKIDALKNIQWIDGEYFAKASFSIDDVNFDAGATIPTDEFAALEKAAKAIFAEGGDRLKFILYDVLKTLDLQFTARLNIAETKLSLTALINQLLASSSQRIDIPIDIVADNLDQIVHFDIKWNLDFRKHSNSEAYIMLYTDSGLFEVKFIFKSNVLYIDLSRVGLIKVKISNFNLTALIDSILSDSLDVVNTDITNLITGLLFPNGDMGNLEDMGDGTFAAVGNYMSKVGQATYTQNAMNTAIENVDIFAILGKVLGNLSISDLIAQIGMNSDLVAEILQNVGVALGAPLAAEGSLNLPEGALRLDISLKDSLVGLDIKLVKIGGPKRYIDWGYFTEKFVTRVENPTHTPEDKLPNQAVPSALATEFLDYGEYSLVSGYDLMMSVFQSVKYTEDPTNGYSAEPAMLSLNTNFTNIANGGASGYNNAKLSVNRCLDYATVIGGKYTASRGAIRLTLFKYNDTTNPIVYITLDPAINNINILGTADLFNAVVVNGSLVSVNVPLDLAGTLGALMQPIFDMIPDGVYNGGIESTPTADRELMDGVDASKLDVNEILTNITLNVLNSGHIKVTAAINGTALNDMLITLLDNLFWTLDLGDLTGYGPSRIRYKAHLDANSNTGFFNELWSNLIKPLVGKQVGSAVEGIADLVKSQVGDVVHRLLPLPRFDYLQLTADLLNGKVSNMFLESRRKKSGVTYQDDNLPNFTDYGQWQGEQLGIEIYSTQAKDEPEWNPAFVDYRDWKKQSGKVVYDPYEGGNLASQFNTQARRYHEKTNRHHDYTKSNITWLVKNPATGNYDSMTQPSDNNGFNNNFLSNASFRNTYGKLDQLTGAYQYTLRASADGFYVPNTGNKKNQTIDVPVTIYPKGNIVSIKDVVVAQHGVLPDEAIANLDVTLPDNSVIQVSRSIKTTIYNANRTKPYDEGESFYINQDNVTAGPHVNIDGVNYGVNVQYMSSKPITYGRNIVIDAYTMNDFTRTLPDRIYFAYENGVYNSSKVLWDSSQLNLTQEQWIKGTGDNTLTITAKLLDEINLNPSGDTRQVLMFDVTILNTEAQSVKFDSELSNDIISINPFDILNAKQTGETSGLFPTNATITYADSHTDVRDIVWNGTNIDDLFDLITPEGGRYSEVLSIRNANGDVSWTMPVVLNIERRVPKYVTFGKNEDGSDIRTLHVNPYDVMYIGIDAVLPPKINVVYEQGDSMLINVAWDTTNLKIEPDGGTYIVPVTIAPNTKLSRTLNVQVVVDRIQIAGLAYENNTLVFDYAPEVIYGGKNKNDFLPKTVPVITTEGNLINVPAVMDFSDVNIDIYGNPNAIAKATVGSGTHQQTFEFKVIVPSPTLIGVEKGADNLWVDIADIRDKGYNAYPKTYKFVFEHYNGSTITKELPVYEWQDEMSSKIDRVEMIIDGKTYDVEVPGAGGIITATIANSKGAFAQSLDLNMKITQTIDKFNVKEITVKYEEGKELKLPNTLKTSVTTKKIDRTTNAKTDYEYECDFPVTWDTTNFNIFTGGVATAIFREGNVGNELRYPIVVKTESAPQVSRFKIASNQAVTLSYNQFVESGVELMPKNMKWNLMSTDGSSILGTYSIPSVWDITGVNFKTVEIVNGVAKFNVGVMFNIGPGSAKGNIELIINNIPMLNNSDKTMQFTHSDFIRNPSALFKSTIDMLHYSGTVAVLKPVGVKWDLAELRNDLATNNSSDNFQSSIQSAVYVVLNGGTAYEVRYKVTVTVTGVTQTL